VSGNPRSSTSIASGIAGTVYGVAQLSSTASTTALSDNSIYPFYSRISASILDQVRALRDSILYFSQFGLGWTDVAIISTTDAYGLNLAESFIEASEDQINVRTFQQILFGQDISVEIREVKQGGARVILGLVFFTEWSNLIVTADQNGLVGENYVWYTSHNIVDIPPRNETARKLTKGVIGAFQFIPHSGPKYEAFVDRWQTLDPAVYPQGGPGTIPGPFVLLEYDLIITAGLAVHELDLRGRLDQPGRIPAEEWTEVLRSLDFEGITGRVVFDENGDRITPFRVLYFDQNTENWETAAVWSIEAGYVPETDIVWFSNTTDIPDLDIRPPFHYWSCHDEKEKFDPTGKEVTTHTPDSSDVDDIDSDYHCDQFIDCQNLSDERVDCSQNYLAMFIVFGVITLVLILIVVLLFIFVVTFGTILGYRRLRTSSPSFLLLMLLSMFVGYSSIFAWYGKPHPVACGFQPWLLGLATISMILALNVKIFRVWKIFNEQMKRHRISDLRLLVLWLLGMIPAVFILVIWTIVSTPTATMKERDGIEHYVCTTGGFTGEPGGLIFFFILVGYGAFILLVGIVLSVASRNVPSQFNEGKLLAISVYNIVFLSVVVIPVFMVLQAHNPFLAWILRTCAILYGFTATMVLQFAHPVFGIVVIDKCKNKKIFKSKLRFSSTPQSAQTTETY